MALADHIPGAPKAAERAARIAGIVEEIGELVEELDMLVGPEAGERVSTDMAIWEAQAPDTVTDLWNSLNAIKQRKDKEAAL